MDEIAHSRKGEQSPKLNQGLQDEEITLQDVPCDCPGFTPFPLQWATLASSNSLTSHPRGWITLL